MANPWFRMYSEFATDAKVQSMPEAMQRRLTMLFCLRCSDVTVTLCDEELAFQLRISDQELGQTKELFLRKGFIDDAWDILNWDKRQFASDSSAARTAAYRERKKQGHDDSKSSQKRRSDALDTDTDTEADKKKKITTAQTPAGFARFWAAYPKKKSKGDAEKAFKAIKPSEQVLEAILQAIPRAMTSVEWMKEGGQFIPYPATWLRAKGWEDVIDDVTLTPDGQAKPWWQSASAIATKGSEYGLTQGDEAFPLFRDRVYRAVGDGPWNRGASA